MVWRIRRKRRSLTSDERSATIVKPIPETVKRSRKFRVHPRGVPGIVYSYTYAATLRAAIESATKRLQVIPHPQARLHVFYRPRTRWQEVATVFVRDGEIIVDYASAEWASRGSQYSAKGA